MYAYIIIYFLDKWKLLKLDWLIAAVLIVFTVITGELSGLIHWNILGYTYIPGNFFTRALPYILVGCFIHRNIDRFVIIRRGYYVRLLFIGVLLMILEILGLGYFGVDGYYGHLIGMPLTAFSACVLAFNNSNPEPGFEAVLCMPRQYVNHSYYLCQPVSVLIAFLFSAMGGNVFAEMVNLMGIATFIVCFVIAWLISFVSLRHSMRKIKADEQSN